MYDALFWIYLLNLVFLINHEIDSAYWQEWKLFKLPGGHAGFLAIHFPILLIVIYSLIELWNTTGTGLIISLIVSISGLFAFVIHIYFIKKGRPEFRRAISLFILFGIMVLSLIQFALTLYLFVQ